jgi:hypothetical protein
MRICVEPTTCDAVEPLRFLGEERSVPGGVIPVRHLLVRWAASVGVNGRDGSSSSRVARETSISSRSARYADIRFSAIFNRCWRRKLLATYKPTTAITDVTTRSAISTGSPLFCVERYGRFRPALDAGNPRIALAAAELEHVGLTEVRVHITRQRMQCRRTRSLSRVRLNQVVPLRERCRRHRCSRSLDCARQQGSRGGSCARRCRRRRSRICGDCHPRSHMPGG